MRVERTGQAFQFPKVIVVDLDGTLTPTDTLWENFLEVIKSDPLTLVRIPVWLCHGRARLKAELASRALFRAGRLPWRADFIDYLMVQRGLGRKIVLATAANDLVANEVARHLGFFDEVISSDAVTNLKGSRKLDAIRQKVSEPFVYAGDCAADIPIWNGSSAAIFVGTPLRVMNKVDVPTERSFANPRASLLTWFRAIRLHQWLKNLLVFVPLLTSLGFMDAAKNAAAVGAFVAFGLAASGTYILNDLWDLSRDRQHPRKRARPFASAELSIAAGLVVALMLLFVALLTAFALDFKFALMLLAYIAITTAYSWHLKQYFLMDVVVLAVLYTWRVLAGAVVIDVIVSPWLLAFSVFVFFSLALVKRCAELVVLRANGQDGAGGRDYRVTDLEVLWPMGIGASLASVVVFCLYIGSGEVLSRYQSGYLLWFVGIGLLYWLGRMWIKTGRGEMHDDPIVFSLRDRGSRYVIFSMVALTLVAHLGSPA